MQNYLRSQDRYYIANTVKILSFAHGKAALSEILALTLDTVETGFTCFPVNCGYVANGNDSTGKRVKVSNDCPQ